MCGINYRKELGRLLGSRLGKYSGKFMWLPLSEMRSREHSISIRMEAISISFGNGSQAVLRKKGRDSLPIRNLEDLLKV